MDGRISRGECAREETRKEARTHPAEVPLLHDGQRSGELVVETHEQHRIQGVVHGHIPPVEAAQALRHGTLLSRVRKRTCRPLYWIVGVSHRAPRRAGGSRCMRAGTLA